MNADRVAAVLGRFKTSLVQFLDDIIETFPREDAFVTLRILVKDQVSPVIIMDAFVKQLGCIEDQVARRDASFFADSNPLFAAIGCPGGFAAIWNSPSMLQENRDAMWQWLSELVKVAQLYARIAT